MKKGRSIVIGVESFERNNEEEFFAPRITTPIQIPSEKITVINQPIESNLQWPTGFMYNYAYLMYNYKIWNNF
jgi:hypothetical protein